MSLKDFDVLRNLSPATLERLSEVGVSLAFEAGTDFIRQGDPPTGLYCLQTGRVKLYRQSRERAQILAVINAGETFGAESLSSHSASPCTAEALAAGQAAYFPPDDLQHLLEAQLDLSLLLLELVTHRLRQFTGLVHSLAFRDVSTRLAEVLLKQESHQTDEGLCIKRIFSQQDLAALVGTAREVVYRSLKKFEQDGLLRLTSTDIIILDLERLTNLANQELR